MLYLAPSSLPIEIRGLTFDTNGKRGMILEVDGRTGVVVDDVTFVGNSYPSNMALYAGVRSTVVQNSRSVTFQHCTFQCNAGVFLINVLDARVEHCAIEIFFPRQRTDANNPAHQCDNDGVQLWGCRRIGIRRNTFSRGSETYYYARAVQSGALKVSHGQFGAAEACGVEDILISHNAVSGSGEPGGNNGEVFVGDSFNGLTGGSLLTPVASATSTTISVATATFAVNSATDPIGSHVIIVAGTGAGQVRRVVGNTTTALTVDESWDVTPDSTSTFIMEVFHARQLYVYNSVTACPKYIGNYGPSIFGVVARNAFDSSNAPSTPTFPCGVGFFSLAASAGSAIKCDPAYYNLVADNALTAAQAFLSYQGFATNNYPALPVANSNAILRNSAAGVTEVVELALSGNITPTPATWGTHNLVARNGLGAGATDQASIDGAWDATLYQGLTTQLVDGGSNTVVVP
jgi:hypothetical protein